jgi:hypothetical protein
MRTMHRVALALAVCPLLAPPAVADPRPARLTVQVSPVAIPPGGRLFLHVALSPPGAGTVVVQQRFGTGRWREVATRAVSGGDGSFRVRLGRRTRVGRYAFRVAGPVGSGLTATSGEAVSRVTVTGAGRPTSWRPLHGTRRAPHHWTSCSLRYLVNPAGMPRRGMADLREALRRVALVSGTRFEYAGTTTVVPVPGYAGPGPDQFVVAWAGSAPGGLLDSATAGRAGTFADDTGRLRTGFLLFNTDWVARSPSGFGAGQPHGVVMMHEAGHLLGLGHASDPQQVMTPSVPHPAAVWGAGDLRGLRRLGRVMGCLPAQPR